MEVDTIFHLVTWRREVDRLLGVSIDFDDKNNLVRVAGERIQRIRAIPELCDQDLGRGDIIEIVNERTNHVEIQKGFRSALNIHMKIVLEE